MTTKTADQSAQKERQKKIILVALGVVLLAVVALQAPKLLGGSDAPAPAAAPATTDATSGTGTTTGTTPTGTAQAVTGVATPPLPAGTPRVVLVGVTVGTGGAPPARDGQLRRFTLFTAKDPFVQTAHDDSSTSGTSGSTDSGSTDGGSSSGGSTSGGSGSTPPPAAAPPTYATVAINGDPEPVTTKKPFPAGDPMFVIVALTKKGAKLAVAGGAFTDAETIMLKLGQSVTLVNTATGARYSVKLLYVGTEPEQVQGFTQAAEQDEK